MALFTFGDPHLSFGNPEKTMVRFGEVWIDHEKKIKENCNRLISPNDTLVIDGDLSWGKKLEECKEDLNFLAALPGRKILIRGNHDMFWTVNKTASLNERFKDQFFFLQNNFAPYQDYAIVGTKGFCFEGPFYLDAFGKVVGYDEEAEAQADKLVERELGRLKLSFDAAIASGYHKFILFLHYPPTSMIETESPFTKMAEKYHVEQVIYAHSHGKEHFHESIQGIFHGINYSLVSGDYLNFVPKKILD